MLHTWKVNFSYISCISETVVISNFHYHKDLNKNAVRTLERKEFSATQNLKLGGGPTFKRKLILSLQIEAPNFSHPEDIVYYTLCILIFLVADYHKPGSAKSERYFYFATTNQCSLKLSLLTDLLLS
jgi:hypothetical protein